MAEWKQAGNYIDVGDLQFIRCADDQSAHTLIREHNSALNELKDAIYEELQADLATFAVEITGVTPEWAGYRRGLESVIKRLSSLRAEIG